MKRRSLLALGALAVLVAACGIPVSNQASVVPSRNVPFRLTSPTLHSVTTTTLLPAPTVVEPIYLTKNGDSLVVASRNVAVPAGLVAVVDALLAGPTAAETAQGLTSAIPSSARLEGASIAGSTATLVMSPSFTSISGANQVLAVGQLVLTVTRQPGVSSVAFMVGTSPVSVPTVSGASTTAPVTAAQYASLLSP
jgi:hypothetical protein